MTPSGATPWPLTLEMVSELSAVWLFEFVWGGVGAKLNSLGLFFFKGLFCFFLFFLCVLICFDCVFVPRYLCMFFLLLFMSICFLDGFCMFVCSLCLLMFLLGRRGFLAFLLGCCLCFCFFREGDQMYFKVCFLQVFLLVFLSHCGPRQILFCFL